MLTVGPMLQLEMLCLSHVLDFYTPLVSSRAIQ